MPARSIVQLVGTAHIAVEPRNPTELEQRLAHLAELSDDELALELLTTSRSGSGHERSPLDALLDVCHANEWHPQDTRIVLVATNQDPPHPADTLPIAGLVERALRHSGDLRDETLGFDVRIAEARNFDSGEVSLAVRDAVRGSDEAILMLGPGSTALQIGCLLGCLCAGSSTGVVELNRQDADSFGQPVRLDTQARLVQSLVSTGQYRAAAAAAGDDRVRNALECLAAASDVDWRELRARASQFDKTKRLLGQLPDANSSLGTIDRWTRFAARSQIRRRDRSAYLLAIRLCELELRRLLAEDRQLGDDLTKACDDSSCEAGHGREASVEVLMRCSYLRNKGPKRLRAMVRANDAVWAKARRLRHDHAKLDLGALERFVARLPAVDAVEQPVLASVGLSAADDRERRSTVFSAVGHRFDDGAGRSPIVDAITAEGEPEQLVLLCTESTAASAAGHDCVAVEVPDTAARSVRACLDAFRSTALAPPSSVMVVVAPGTQAMNVALILAAVEFAFEHGVELTVRTALVHQETSDSEDARTLLSARSAVPLRELAPQSALAKACDAALASGEFELAGELLERGPGLWERTLAKRIAKIDAAFHDNSTPVGDKIGLLMTAAMQRPLRSAIEAFVALEAADDQRRFGLNLHRTPLSTIRNDFVHTNKWLEADPAEVRSMLQALASDGLRAELRQIRDVLGDLAAP